MSVMNFETIRLLIGSGFQLIQASNVILLIDGLSGLCVLSVRNDFPSEVWFKWVKG